MQFDTKNYWLAKQSYYDINIYDGIYLNIKKTKRDRRNIGLNHIGKKNISFFSNSGTRINSSTGVNTTIAVLSNILALTLLTGQLAKPILASKSIAHLHIKKGMATGAITRSLEPFWYFDSDESQLGQRINKNYQSGQRQNFASVFKIHDNIWNSAKWLNSYSYFSSKRNIVLHCANSYSSK